MVRTGIGIGQAIAFVGVVTGVIPPSLWILAHNYWDDSGIWIDSDTWND